MIRLVHLDRSRSERIIRLLEELGLPLRPRRVQRRPVLMGQMRCGRRTSAATFASLGNLHPDLAGDGLHRPQLVLWIERADHGARVRKMSA